MDVDESGGHSALHPPEVSQVSRGDSVIDENEIDGPHNVLTQPNGVVIIEKLDTPAIRRERNIRRKAEKQRQAALGPDGASISTGSSNLSAGNPSVSAPYPRGAVQQDMPPPETGQDSQYTKDAGIEDDMESELSELSDDSDGSEEYRAEDAPVLTPSTSSAPRLKATKSVRPKKVRKIENYEDGTIGGFYSAKLMSYFLLMDDQFPLVWAKSGELQLRD